MKAIELCVCFFMMVLGMPAWASNGIKEKTEIVFYVSPKGDDLQSGTRIENAYATLSHARDAIRVLKREGKLTLPVTVYILGGRYELTNPFNLTTEDSGKETCPITYCAYNHEEVMICGGKRLHQLIHVQGKEASADDVEYIHFTGIVFSHATDTLGNTTDQTSYDQENLKSDAVILLDHVRNCVFRDNIIRNVVSNAIFIDGNATKITGNTIYDVGGTGIINQTSANGKSNQIAYNRIYNCGLICPAACGIKNLGSNVQIFNNLIHHIPSAGIDCNSEDRKVQDLDNKSVEQQLQIEYNEIHDVMRHATSGGGITVKNTRAMIRNNLLYDITSTSGSVSSGYGIYLDQGTQHTTVENNILKHVTSGIYLGGCHKQTAIVNNVFLQLEDHVLATNNPEGQRNEGLRFINNIVYGTHSDVCIYRLDHRNSLPTISDFNVYWNPYECFTQMSFLRLSDAAEEPFFRGVERFFDWQNLGFDTHSIAWNPDFENVSEGDYSLKTNSLAFRLGIKNIDISHVGLRACRDKK